MPIPLIAYEISGVKQPTYGSGATNKTYVDNLSGAIVTHVDNNYYDKTWIDTFSGNIDSRIDSLEGDNGVTWSEISTEGGLSARTFGVSGTGIGNISVLGYSTISSNAKTAKDWYTESSQKLSVAYTERGSQIAGDHLDWDGTELDVSDDWYDDVGDIPGYIASANAVARFADSSNIQTKFLQTANIAKGWASVPEDNPIAHGLSSRPTSVFVTPSGMITFATAIGHIDNSNFWISTSALGNRLVNWRAEV